MRKALQLSAAHFHNFAGELTEASKEEHQGCFSENGEEPLMSFRFIRVQTLCSKLYITTQFQQEGV